jgi:small subunit ribosomal protein S20
MPVTKTAKRALRVSKKKQNANSQWRAKLEIALRAAKKEKSKARLVKAISLADRLAKNNIIHKNKAARIKKILSL